MVVECESDPAPLPVSFSEYVPGDAVDDADIVSVDVAVPPTGGVIEVGLNVAVTPSIGGDVILSETEEL